MTTDQAANYGSLVGVFLVAIFAQLNARRAKKDRIQIKKELQVSDAKHSQKLDSIHELVNGDKILLLEKVASLSRRIAIHTDDIADRAEAARADEVYQRELMAKRERDNATHRQP